MWRARTFLGVTLGALALVLLLGVLGSSSAASASTATHSSGCPVHYRPSNLTVASCSVPSGGTFSYICGINWSTLTLKWCTSNSVDLNPADWFSWFGCSLITGLSTVGSYIWNAVAGVFAYIFTAIGNWITGAVNAVVTAIENAITGIISAVANAVISVENAIDSFAAATGPLSPIVITALWLAIGVVLAVGVYLSLLGIIALGKSIFNLL